ncbi:expressed unknown protein [Seminavis robusta]|uniref:Uncharacterized protein n=1 Tax=Seminavis robusta TaxID=568900 RepID=A0A9N8HLL9_9STRA|nr:expressed unknown protein [Seminavis robusta]|eukprot:Sro1042_g234700.1 n/a (860) ;mRNA; f:27357-29936
MSYRRSASYTRDQINELITLFPEAAHLKNRLKQDEDLESLFQDTMVHLANVMGDSSAVVQEFLRRRSQKRMKDEKRARQRAGVRFLEELVVQEQAEAEEARENNTDPLTSSSPMGKTPLDKVSKLFRGILASTVEEEDPFSHRSSRDSNECRTPSSTSRSGQDPTMQREGVISEPAREEPAENTQAWSSASSTTSTPSATPSETPSATSSTRTPSRETPLQEQKKEQEQEPANLIEPEETRSPATVLPPSEPRAPFDLPVPQRQQQQQFSHEQSSKSTKRVSYGVVGTVAEQATCNIPIYGPPKSWGQNNDNYYILNGRPQSTSNRTKTLHSSFSMSPKYQRRQLQQQPLRQQRPIRLDAPPQHSINELQTPSLVSELSLNSFAQSHESIGQMDAPPPPPPPQQQQQQPRHDDQSMNPVSQTSTTCTNTAQSSVVQVDPPQHTKGDHQILTNRTQRNATTLTQFRDKFGHMMNGSRQHTKPGHNQTLIPVSNGSPTMTAKSISQTAAPTQHAKTDHQSLGQRATTGKQSYDSFGQRVFPPRHTQCFHQTLLPVAQNSTTTSIPLLQDPFDRPVKDENSKRPRFPSQNVDLTFSSSSLDILRQDSDPQTIPAATPIVDIAASCSDSVSSGSVCVVEDDIATHTPANVPQQPTYVQGSSNALQIMVSNPPLVHATSRVVANFYREVMRSRAKPLMDASPASSFGAGNTPRSEGSFDYRKSPQHHNHQSANPSSVNAPHSQGSFDCSKSPHHHSHPNVEPSSVHLDPKDSPHHSETSVSVPSKASLGSATKHHQMLPVSGGDKPSSNHGLSSPLVSQIYPAFSHSNQSSPGLGLNHNFSSLLPFDHQKSHTTTTTRVPSQAQ